MIKTGYITINESESLNINESLNDSKDIDNLKKMLKREKEIEKIIAKNGFEGAIKYKDEYHKLLSDIGILASKIDGKGAIHGKGIIAQLSESLVMNESVSEINESSTISKMPEEFRYLSRIEELADKLKEEVENWDYSKGRIISWDIRDKYLNQIEAIEKSYRSECNKYSASLENQFKKKKNKIFDYTRDVVERSEQLYNEYKNSVNK